MITPGITDNNIEAFAIGDNIKVIYKGSVIDLRDSIDVIGIFRKLLEDDPQALSTVDGLEPMEQVEMFVRCRFGDLDKRADLSEDGIVLPEYWDCGRRGKCQHEGVLCLLPAGLTKREIDIVRMVASDLTDKEIADKLNIAYNTVHTHIRNIEQKINAASKCGIVSFAFKNNII